MFAEEERKRVGELAKLNMLEMQVSLNYQAPNNYKEERTAYHAYGDKSGLFVPNFGETDFNFYRNFVKMEGIAEVPVVSPISKTSILSYKYKLIEILIENGETVYQIEVIPRKKGNSTCKGYIYINEELWNINRLDLSFYKDGLKFMDKLRLKQNYEQVEDALWIPNRIEFIYETKVGKYRDFKGSTVMRFTDFENNYSFPPKFFNNAIVETTQDAYERNLIYWEELRFEPLKVKEIAMTQYRDSVTSISISYTPRQKYMTEPNRKIIIGSKYPTFSIND